jgi:hypothetical protein
MNTFRKTIIGLALLIITVKASAPARDGILFPAGDPVKPFKKLIWAIGMVETKLDTLAYNPVEEAVGFFQIRPIRVEDYNTRTGSSVKMNELYDYKVSEKIFLYYANLYGPGNFELIARRWNGSGPKTYHYWNRVKKLL